MTIFIGLLQVISLHTAAQKFVSLIPFITEKEHIQNMEVDWKKETIEVPVAAKLRVLAGNLYTCNFLTLCGQ